MIHSDIENSSRREEASEEASWRIVPTKKLALQAQKNENVDNDS